MSDSHCEDQQQVILDLVDDSIIAWSRVRNARAAEGTNSTLYIPVRSVDAVASPELPARILEVQVAFQSRPINASSLCAGSRGGLVVEPVLELPEKLQVFDRHEGRNALAAPIQNDAFAALGDTVERGRERIPNRACSESRHSTTSVWT